MTTVDNETGGAAPRKRLHLRGERNEQRELRRQRVAAAIAALETGEPGRFPDVPAILDHADGTISRNRVYEEQDLMYAAQSRWNRREEAQGRKARKLRGGDPSELDDWVPKADLDEANAHLRRAIEEIRDLRARNERLSKANAALRLDVERLEAGVYEEVWPPTSGGSAQRDSGPCNTSPKD